MQCLQSLATKMKCSLDSLQNFLSNSDSRYSHELTPVLYHLLHRLQLCDLVSNILFKELRSHIFFKNLYAFQSGPEQFEGYSGKSLVLLLQDCCEMQVRRMSSSSYRTPRPSRTFCPTSCFIHSWITSMSPRRQLQLPNLLSPKWQHCIVQAPHFIYLLGCGANWGKRLPAFQQWQPLLQWEQQPAAPRGAHSHSTEQSYPRGFSGDYQARQGWVPSFTTICFYIFYSTEHLPNPAEIGLIERCCWVWQFLHRTLESVVQEDEVRAYPLGLWYNGERGGQQTQT